MALSSPEMVFEPAAQPCALDRSSYSRRAGEKSTVEANYFGGNEWDVPSVPHVPPLQGLEPATIIGMSYVAPTRRSEGIVLSAVNLEAVE